MAAIAVGRQRRARAGRPRARRYPDDPRLHFLRGSILAGIGRPIEALPALQARRSRSRPISPIARFQLGFFQLTSGEAADALATWGPLALLPDGHYLRTVRDRADPPDPRRIRATIAQLRAGIAANEENPPLNRDMQLIIEQGRAKSPTRRPRRTRRCPRPACCSANSDRDGPNVTQIGPADQVLLLLREQLKAAERGKPKKTERSAKTAGRAPRERLAALAAIEDLPERDFRRAMVRGLLAERLGEELVADPAFEAAAIEICADHRGFARNQKLLDRAAGTFRSGLT